MKTFGLSCKEAQVMDKRRKKINTQLANLGLTAEWPLKRHVSVYQYNQLMCER